MKNLTMILMLAVAFVLSASSAKAQKNQPAIVDVSIYTFDFTRAVNLGSDVTYPLYIDVEHLKEATNVTVSAQLAEGVTPISIVTDVGGTCAFNGNLITCNYPKLGEAGAIRADFNAAIFIKARPLTAGIYTLTASIRADQTDPNLSNNSVSLAAAVGLPAKRKRVRLF